ncbi:hypothetical protein [Methylibium petroleiphilum]|uniref:Uncharacterized protein n=1 Tax=Methylibium petroleiphilum (strain ATCC BAA-1232 / LMG 22953 / PM1) TaxID=420662 RepID=A2SN51_METPP|nr:hypothetical protein [Methylibium petroleiphilum]ABM96990.1 hypothetical protein Mpe_B0215 [Methylibium petroleiphilum PM1]
MLSKRERAEKVNAFLAVVGDCGRRFFRHDERRARMEVDARGHVWFVDDYSQKRIYTHHEGRWSGFSHGGTLRDLVRALRDHIRTGQYLPAHSLGPWPSWYSGGDPWAYGDDMVQVRQAAIDQGLLAPPAEAKAA